MVSSGKHRAFGHARGSNDPKPREVAKLRFETYNVRNLSDARLEGLIAYMKERNVFAMTIQETWRSGEYQETNQNFLLIGRGPACIHAFPCKGTCHKHQMLKPKRKRKCRLGYLLALIDYLLRRHFYRKITPQNTHLISNSAT